MRNSICKILQICKNLEQLNKHGKIIYREKPASVKSCEIKATLNDFMQCKT